MQALQETAAYNINEMRKHQINNNTNVGAGAMIRKYNEDVRKTRENEEMLGRFWALIRKA